MRIRKKKNDPDNRISEMIATNYNRLRDACNVSSSGNYAGITKEDIFSETIWYVIHDPKSLLCTSADDFIKHFQYRFRMIEFQITKDANLLKEIPYADHIQTKKEISEE